VPQFQRLLDGAAQGLDRSRREGQLAPTLRQ
jgi:hypothetical protein